MSHVYRWHPQLTAGADGPMVGKSLLHLQQSDLDSACGHHCALMALRLFKLIGHHDVEKLSQTKKQPLASFWQRAAPYYFTGSRPGLLASFFKPFHQQLTCCVVKRNPVIDAIQTLRADGLCIIGIRNRKFTHWALAVGYGRRDGHEKENKLLVLDPSHEALPMLPWNATLTTTANRRGMHHYETTAGRCKVYFDTALLILPYIDELEVNLDVQ